MMIALDRKPAKRAPARRRLRPILAAYLCLLVSALALAGCHTWSRLDALLHPDPLASGYTLSSFPFAAATRDVTFPSLDGTALSAWFVPAGLAGRPSIILLAGYGQDRASLLPQAAYLHRAGYNVLLLDVRGTGDSAGAFTFGMKEPLDVRAAVSFVLDQPGVDPHRIAVQGVSIGGSIAILAAARDPRVTAVVAESAFTSLEEMIVDDFHRYTKLPLFPVGDAGIWLMQRALGGSVAAVDPLRAMHALAGRPVLLIGDSEDAVSPPDSAARLYAAADDPKELWLIQGTEHANGFLVFPHAYQRHVLGFYHQYLDGTDEAS
jgi:pimeloyl-ACP methyl ester carboxylesterase